METINFRQKRDFGEIMEATFSFTRMHFFKLFKLILFISGGPLIGGAVLMGVVFSSIFGMALDPEAMNQSIALGRNPMPFSAAIIPAYILLIIGFLSFYIVVNSYIALYAAGEDTSFNSIWAEYKRVFWPYLGWSIIFVMITTIGMMFCFIPGIFLWVNFVMMFIVISVERNSSEAAISRAGSLMKGVWWETFGLYIIVWLIIIVMAGIFSVPMYIIQFASMFHSFSEAGDDPTAVVEGMQGMMSWMAVYLPIYYFGIMLVNILGIVAIALKYFSIVESKEGVGDMERIAQIGDQ